MSNKYVNRSKISEAKFRELVRLFALDLTATQITELSGLNRNTVNRYLNGIRDRIAEYCDVVAPVVYPQASLNGEEKDAGEIIFLWEKAGNIYSHLGARTAFISPEGGMKEQMFGHQPHAYIDIKKETQHYVCGIDAKRKKQNRLKGYWGFIKSRLSKFKGMHDSTLFYHLKECEFRHNHDQDELYSLILKIIRNDPLF